MRLKKVPIVAAVGGGLLTDDLIEIRVKGAMPRMEALKNVVDDYGVTHMAAICAICKSQFSKVFPYYDFRMDQIVSLHQLVSNAIVLEPENASEGDENETTDEDDQAEAELDNNFNLEQFRYLKLGAKYGNF